MSRDKQPETQDFVKSKTFKLILSGSLLAGVMGGAAFFAAKRYHVCSPNQYMICTGLGIQDMLVTKTGVRWPLKKVRFFDTSLEPMNLNSTTCPLKRSSSSFPSCLQLGQSIYRRTWMHLCVTRDWSVRWEMKTFAGSLQESSKERLVD